MNTTPDLEAPVKEVAAGTEKILLQELRDLIVRSAPMMANISGDQACLLLAQTIEKWGQKP